MATPKIFSAAYVLAIASCGLSGSIVVSGCIPDPVTTARSAATDTPEPDTSEDLRSWRAVQRIIQNRCVTCHAEPGPEAGLDLSLPSVVQAEAIEGELLARLNDELDPMPPSGILPMETRQLFSDWIERGAPMTQADELWPSPYAGVNQDAARPARETAVVKPFDVTQSGFEFLERMQGHWIGSMNLMGQDMPWFAFDYRAIGPSHVHGIFEGGTMGNLMTSFFFGRFRGTNTIMARNGGILNGIYRTSYFVLDRVDQRGAATTYRFVDAIGGESIMWMSLEFEGDLLNWEAYTSRMGEQAMPTLHMSFDAKRRCTKFAEAAAESLGFPARHPVLDLPDGFEKPDWGEYGPVTSASYMWQSRTASYEQMGTLARDPIRIEDLPYLARLTLSIERPEKVRDSKLLVYLSTEPLTDSNGALRTRWGYVQEELFDSVILFPEINRKQDEFTMTYLHPGQYSLTVVADMDADSVPGSDDVVLLSQRIEIAPGSHPRIVVNGGSE